MQSRRPGVSPLAIVLPHPQLPRRRSSLLSTHSASAPRTPTTGLSPNCSSIFFTPSRKSTDSWNSSNADELEWEWKPEQVLLLSRTLDALPAHLVTPFNGPIPPPNLLDKIARGVSQAKGPVEWPHSIRATRVKLIELARLKAKDETLVHQRKSHVIAEEPEVEIEDGSSDSYTHGGLGQPMSIRNKRPIYRQSSMDFIDPAGTDVKDNENIARLSRRLQRSDRTFPNPTFHPYNRPGRTLRRSTSPPPLAHVPSLISPSTESSDTLNSLSSFSSEPRAIRRSMSSLSSLSILSGSSSGIAIDPRVQRIRRSESISAGSPKRPSKGYPSSLGLKRAPSYGVLAQEARRDHLSSPGKHVRRDSGSYPSSDEEEKARTQQAKKPRTKSIAKSPVVGSPTPSIPGSPSVDLSSKPPPVPEKDKKYVKARSKGVASPVQDENVKSLSPSSPAKSRTARVDVSVAHKDSPASVSHGVKRAPMKTRKTSNMFGPELPQIPKASAPPASTATPLSPAKPRGTVPTPTKMRAPSSPSLSPSSPIALSPAMQIVPNSPAQTPPETQRVKTLRRVRRLVPSRRISFGSMLSGSDDMDLGEGDARRTCLGSAFQLL